MDGKLRSMASVYLVREGEILLLYRSGGIAKNTYIGSTDKLYGAIAQQMQTHFTALNEFE